MPRHFNTAGPCDPIDHYMLAPERRLAGLREVIDQKAYFILHAPRQVGKTTALLALARSLTAEGRYAAITVSMEVGAPFSREVGAAENAVLAAWRARAASWLPEELQPPPWPVEEAGSRIGAALQAWSRVSPRPLVVFLDEIDALRDQALLSVLRQLRDRHPNRPQAFPWSLGLVGLRDVRDYKIASGGSAELHTASPFNIKVESLTMRDFTEAEVTELYDQHTRDTGQRFESEAVARAFEFTRGQPWLLNALARQIVQVLVPDRTEAITVAHVEAARDLLIERQDTHLDSLAERLRDPRVRAVIEPMIQGETLPWMPPDDLRFVIDLGLVRETRGGALEVANPIYREVIARQLTVTLRASLPELTPTWINHHGRIDFDKLLDAFIEFWLRHGEALLASSPYNEAAAHLVLMAFLHRVVNGGGRIDREYAIGAKRLDLCLEHRGDKLGIEVKTWRESDKAKDPVVEGLQQLDGYLSRIGVTHGWLVLFDQRKNATALPERMTREHVGTEGGRGVEVIRL